MPLTASIRVVICSFVELDVPLDHDLLRAFFGAWIFRDKLIVIGICEHLLCKHIGLSWTDLLKLATSFIIRVMSSGNIAHSKSLH